MTKRIETLAAALSVFLAAAVAASGSPALTGPAPVRLTDKLVRRTHIDQGRRGPSIGDVDFYQQSLFNKGVTPKAIGHADIMCTKTGTNSSNCAGTYFLPKGKIMVGGVIGFRLFYEMAVLGGTGLYDNARGTLTRVSSLQAGGLSGWRRRRS
jgi:hypothetical protein